MYDGLTDDQGRAWEMTFDQKIEYLGETRFDEYGSPLPSQTVHGFKFRPKTDDDSEAWRTLPPWADIRDEWKITLCMFDELDDDGLDLVYWPLVPAEVEEVATVG
jgi:hypothetical protein